MGQVIKLGAQGKRELAAAFKVTMAYVGQILSGQKKGGKAPAIWEAAKTKHSYIYLFHEPFFSPFSRHNSLLHNA